MKKLPVIVGFGGINAAGRSSFHHSYRRMVHEALPEEDLEPMFKGLAALMNLPENTDRPQLLEQTLIRKIEKQSFNLDDVDSLASSGTNFHEILPVGADNLEFAGVGIEARAAGEEFRGGIGRRAAPGRCC